MLYQKPRKKFAKQNRDGADERKHRSSHAARFAEIGSKATDLRSVPRRRFIGSNPIPGMNRKLNKSR